MNTETIERFKMDIPRRMKVGERMSIARWIIEEIFPHPIRLSLAEMEDEIRRLLTPGEEAKPEEASQDEKIDEWCSDHHLANLGRDFATGDLHVEKLPEECCGCRMVRWEGMLQEPMEPAFRPFPSGAYESMEVRTRRAKGHRCMKCGKVKENP